METGTSVSEGRNQPRILSIGPLPGACIWQAWRVRLRPRDRERIPCGRGVMGVGSWKGLLSRRPEVDMVIEELFEELLAKAEAGQLPAKKAAMLRHLKERMASGKPLSEMQEELLRDLGTEYGICQA